MRSIARFLVTIALSLLIVPFLADLHLPFVQFDSLAYAHGGGGGGNGGGGHGEGGGNDGGGRSGAGSHGGAGGGMGHSGGGHSSGMSGHASSSGRGADHDGRGTATASQRGHAGSGVSITGRVQHTSLRAGHHPRQEVGNEVSEAATTTAHAGKAAAQAHGFRNLGQAVSTAVHRAQRDRDRDRDHRSRFARRDRDRNRRHDTRLRFVRRDEDRDRDRDRVADARHAEHRTVDRVSAATHLPQRGLPDPGATFVGGGRIAGGVD